MAKPRSVAWVSAPANAVTPETQFAQRGPPAASLPVSWSAYWLWSSGAGGVGVLGGGDLFDVVGCPGEQGPDFAEQGVAEGGEGVVDPGRDGRVDGAGEQSVAFEAADRHGEHALADSGDG